MAPSIPWADARGKWVLSCTDLIDGLKSGIERKLDSSLLTMRAEALAVFLVSIAEPFPTLIVKPLLFYRRIRSRFDPWPPTRKPGTSTETQLICSRTMRLNVRALTRWSLSGT
jgi:hypothetical protein